MSVYSEVFSIEDLDLSSSFRISFKKNKPEPPSDTYTIRFVNNDYPNVPIPLPESRSVSPGSSITLPVVQGTYEDQDNYYVPQSWSIGNFNEEIIVNSNIEVNLILSVTPKTTTYTIHFENTTYPQFAVNIPEDIIVEEGGSVTLPLVEGSYEDSENIYTPQEWSIGAFGETIIPSSSATANLLWNVQQKVVTYTVTFLNTQLPDIQIDMPQPETGEAGTTITLPTMTGEYESGGKTYQPSSWDIGAFGSTYTITESIEAHLVFDEVITPDELDIDCLGRDPVTIPNGYTVESVKSETAFVFSERTARTDSNGNLVFYTLGKDVYFKDTDTSLIGDKIAPCLRLRQVSQYNMSEGTYAGFYLSTRPTQSPTNHISPIPEQCVLNSSVDNIGDVLLYYVGNGNVVSNVIGCINGGDYFGPAPLEIKRYDENNEEIHYYFNVPTTLWEFQDGVFTWLGRIESAKELPYWYKGTPIRIHCVKI